MIPADNGFFVFTCETSSFGSYGGNDCWLVKIDSNGNQHWSQTCGREKNDYAPSLIWTSDGGYAIVARTDSFGVGGADGW
jgi:hypothetical protein